MKTTITIPKQTFTIKEDNLKNCELSKNGEPIAVCGTVQIAIDHIKANLAYQVTTNNL